MKCCAVNRLFLVKYECRAFCVTEKRVLIQMRSWHPKSAVPCKWALNEEHVSGRAKDKEGRIPEIKTL